MTARTLKTLYTLALVGSLPLIHGCSHVNVKQLAYETLRQQDCRQNNLEDFCSRNFASEYFEYEQLRQEFIRSQNQRVWRVNRDETTLSTEESTLSY